MEVSGLSEEEQKNLLCHTLCDILEMACSDHSDSYSLATWIRGKTAEETASIADSPAESSRQEEPHCKSGSVVSCPSPAEGWVVGEGPAAFCYHADQGLGMPLAAEGVLPGLEAGIPFVQRKELAVSGLLTYWNLSNCHKLFGSML